MEGPIILKSNSDEFQKVLWNGEYCDGERCFHVAPSEMIQTDPQVKSVAFKIVSSRPSTLKIYLESLRAISLTATALPGIVVMLLGLKSFYMVSWPHFILALFGAVFMQIAVNVYNDVEDHLKLIDFPGNPGGSGVLTKGWVSAKALRRFGHVFLALGVLCGIPILIDNFEALLLVGSIGVIGVIGYSGWPLRLKYRALGDVNVFLLCGPVLGAGFSLATFDQIIPGMWQVSVFFGFLACGILHVNNMQDIPLDRESGARTLAGELGYKKSKTVLVSFYFAAYLALLHGVLTSVLPWQVAGTLLLLPVIFQIVSICYKASGPDSPLLNGIRIKAAQAHLLGGILLAISLMFV